MLQDDYYIELLDAFYSYITFSDDFHTVMGRLLFFSISQNLIAMGNVIQHLKKESIRPIQTQLQVSGASYCVLSGLISHIWVINCS